MAPPAKKRKKSYYCGGKNHKKGNFLDTEVQKGFLVTIDPKQERRATLTAYTLLNEAADRLYGPQEKQKNDNNKDDDIEAELKALREESCRFNKLRTDFQATIFIRTTLDKPIDVMTDVYEHISQSVHNILRFVPVVGTCKTQPEVITKKVLSILTELYPESIDTISFMVQLKSRQNNEYKETEKRQKFCQQLAKAIQEANESFKPDLKDPEMVVNVDVLQKICCISLLPHFKRFKKYNPEQFNAEAPQKTKDQTKTRQKDPTSDEIAEEKTIADDGFKEISCEEQTTDDETAEQAKDDHAVE